MFNKLVRITENDERKWMYIVCRSNTVVVARGMLRYMLEEPTLYEANHFWSLADEPQPRLLAITLKNDKGQNVILSDVLSPGHFSNMRMGETTQIYSREGDTLTRMPYLEGFFLENWFEIAEMEGVLAHA